MPKEEEQKQIQFFFTPMVVPQGDGSFVVKPGKPTVGRKKLLIAAARGSRPAFRRTRFIRRLLDAGLLEGRAAEPAQNFCLRGLAGETFGGVAGSRILGGKEPAAVYRFDSGSRRRRRGVGLRLPWGECPITARESCWLREHFKFFSGVRLLTSAATRLGYFPAVRVFQGAVIALCNQLHLSLGSCSRLRFRSPSWCCHINQ
jgi:hypothetical protein